LWGREGEKVIYCIYFNFYFSELIKKNTKKHGEVKE